MNASPDVDEHSTLLGDEEKNVVSNESVESFVKKKKKGSNRVVALYLIALVGMVCGLTALTKRSATAETKIEKSTEHREAIQSAARLLEKYTVKVHNGIPIYASVSVQVDKEKTSYVKLAYRCNSVNLTIGWTKVQHVQSFALHRLRPFTKYTLDILTKESAKSTGLIATAASTSFTTGSTGVPIFDSGPLGIILEGSFSSDVLVIDQSFVGFHGFVGLDFAGYVVWGLNFSSSEYMSKINDLPAHALDTIDQGTIAVLTQGTKQMSMLAPEGDFQSSLDIDDGGKSCGALSHEAFVYVDDMSTRVLTFQHDLTEVMGMDRLQLTQKLVSWDMTRNVLNTHYDLIDFFDPLTDPSYDDPSFNGTLKCARGNDGRDVKTWKVDDYLHCNSASTGNNADFIVSSRGTSTILSLSKDGSGENWRLSTSGHSNFTFKNEDAKFYNQHYVRQRENGNLIMIDNGNQRPDGQWSRAIEYSLDFETMEASVVWQFVPENVYTPEGGSVHVLSNSNRIIFFPFVGNPSGNVIAVYETNAYGTLEGYMFLPWLATDAELDAPSRAFVMNSIKGEAMEN